MTQKRLQKGGRFAFVICAVFFDIYANCIDPVNASLYDSFVKKI